MTPPATSDGRVAAEKLVVLAANLPAGAKRVLLTATTNVTLPGKSTFDANGAWSLHHAKGFGGRGHLLERQSVKCGKHSRAGYFLTALGAELAAALRARAEGVRHDG